MISTIILKLKHYLQGFTLLETLASIVILSSVIIGPLTVISGSSVYARQTKDSMLATYLSEETIELLQNHYSSLYILCKKHPENVLCVSSTGETGEQVAWRLFKDRMGAKDGQPSCYLSDNPSGCAYDSLSMIGDISVTPVRYIADGNECPYLIEVSTSTGTILPRGGGGSNVPSDQNTTYDDSGITSTQTKKRHMYVCKGVVAHVPSTVTIESTKPYTRAVFVEALPTFETGPLLDQYNDDLRITTNVNFKGVNGVTKTIKTVRFIHARQ